MLQPGIRLGNALSLRLSKPAGCAQEQAPGEKTDVERDAQAEWQREYTHIGFRDFVSSIYQYRPDSRFVSRARSPLQLIESGLSLSKHESNLKHREAKLKRLMKTFFSSVKAWH